MVKRNPIMHNEKSIASYLELNLPWPPSVNTYWNFNGSRRFLTAKAKAFKADVWEEFKRSNHDGFSDHRLKIMIYLYPPDKRVRDIDNVCKPLLDALTQAGVFDDDGQVDVLMVFRHNQVKNGGCIVNIFDSPEVL